MKESLRGNLTSIRNKLGVYIHATSLEDFMKKDPPCKECLVNTMCIKDTSNDQYSSIVVNVCDKFNKYLVRKAVGKI